MHAPGTVKTSEFYPLDSVKTHYYIQRNSSPYLYNCSAWQYRQMTTPDTPLDLDALDRRILWTLDLDGRMSISELARRLKVSQQLTSFRFRRLQQRALLGPAITLVNVHLIGLLSFRVYFRLRQIARDDERALCEHLQNRTDVLWFAELRGGWDYEVVFRVKNYVNFGASWKEIQSKFGSFYEKCDISMTTVTYHFRRDYLVRNYRRDFRPVQFGNARALVTLDTIDPPSKTTFDQCKIAGGRVGAKASNQPPTAQNTNEPSGRVEGHSGVSNDPRRCKARTKVLKGPH